MNSTRHGAAEVDEPDLSMELAGSLQRCLEALELEFSKEVRKLEAPCDDLEDEIQCVQLKFADAAASEIVALLRSFNPELEEDDLSHDVHSIIHTQSVVGRLSTPMLAALRSFVPLKRGDWLARDIERHLFRQRRRQQSVWRKALAMLRRRGRSVAKDGQLRATALGVAAGAALGGSGAGALGLVAGGSFGAVCGLLPALVTFGVSVPTGAILGGTTGLVTGAAAGGAAGAVGGGIVARVGWVRRSQLERSANAAWAKVHSLAGSVPGLRHCRTAAPGGTGGTD